MRSGLLYFGLLATAIAQKIDLLSAPWTPMFANQTTINFNAVSCLQSQHVNMGVTTSWIGGNMAQWTAMTDSERLELIQTWAKVNAQASQKLNLIAMVGSNSLKSACDLTYSVTSTCGSDLWGIAIIPPSYLNAPPTLQILVNWMVTIYNCQDGPKLPLFYYHIPGTTNVNFAMADLARAMSAAGVPLAGIKYVDENLLDFYNASQFLGPTGHVYWAPNPKSQSLPFGANKFVLAEDFYAPYVKNIYNAFASGNMDLVQEWEEAMNDVGTAIGVGGPSGDRGVDGLINPACNNGPPLLPLQPSTPAQIAAMNTALQATGFFNVIEKYARD